MDVFVLLFALWHGLGAVPVASATEQRRCADASTRAAVAAAVQARFGALGLPRDLEVLGLVSQLGDARSDQANQVGALFRRQTGLPASALMLCEAPGPDATPMFVTVLYTNPADEQPGGLVFNFGVPGAVASFGEPLPAAEP